MLFTKHVDSGIWTKHEALLEIDIGYSHLAPDPDGVIETYTVQRDDCPLYIYQSEVAILDTRAMLFPTPLSEAASPSSASSCVHRVIGSDDATTCVVLLAHCPATDRVLCTHLDSQKRCKGLAEVLCQLADWEENGELPVVDIYICGGIHGNKDTVGTLRGILDELTMRQDEEDEAEEGSCELPLALATLSPFPQSAPVSVHIPKRKQYNCHYHLQVLHVQGNTLERTHMSTVMGMGLHMKRELYPRNTGFGFRISSSHADTETEAGGVTEKGKGKVLIQLLAMSFPFNDTYMHEQPHMWKSKHLSLSHIRGPERIQRSSACMADSEYAGGEGEGKFGRGVTRGGLRRIDVRGQAGVLYIAPSSSAAWDKTEIEDILSQSDEELLQTCSTSPECEPEHFCEQMRAALSLFLQRDVHGGGTYVYAVGESHADVDVDSLGVVGWCKVDAHKAQADAIEGK